MKLLKKFLALCFLLFGIPYSSGMIWEIMNPKTAPQDKDNAVAALIILTIPSTVMGGWLSWSLVQQNQREQALLIESSQNQIELVFLKLIENNSGKITVLQLAGNAQIPIQSAKQYWEHPIFAKTLDSKLTIEVGTAKL